MEKPARCVCGQHLEKRHELAEEIAYYPCRACTKTAEERGFAEGYTGGWENCHLHEKKEGGG